MRRARRRSAIATARRHTLSGDPAGQRRVALPDVYATIADADVATQERLAGILELRAGDGQQRAMLDSYLSEIDFPAGARVLEIG